MQINDKRNFNTIILIAGIILLMYAAISYLPEILFGIGYLFRLLTPFIVGIAIAFILNVFINIIEKYMIKLVKDKDNSRFVRIFMRPLSLILSIGIFAGAIFILMFLIVPEFRRTGQIIADSFPTYIQTLEGWYDNLSDKVPFDLPESELSSLEMNWEEFNELFSGFVARSGSIFSSAMGITSSIFNVLLHVALGFVFAIFALLQKEKLAYQIKKLLYAYLPVEKVDRILSVSILSHRIFSNFITGQMLEALIIGLICFVGMLVFSFPYASVISVLVGFTALIPVFGALFGTAVGAVLILTVNPMQALWFIVFILVLQQLEGDLIYPIIVGNSIGLPGIWVLAAVTLGGSAFGILGMLLGVPIASILYTLLKEAVTRRLARKNLKDFVDMKSET